MLGVLITLSDDEAPGFIHTIELARDVVRNILLILYFLPMSGVSPSCWPTVLLARMTTDIVRRPADSVWPCGAAMR